MRVQENENENLQFSSDLLNLPSNLDQNRSYENFDTIDKFEEYVRSDSEESISETVEDVSVTNPMKQKKL